MTGGLDTDHNDLRVDYMHTQLKTSDGVLWAEKPLASRSVFSIWQECLLLFPKTAVSQEPLPTSCWTDLVYGVCDSEYFVIF
jgi:hypothetical protein